jgi:hypothetical protein
MNPSVDASKSRRLSNADIDTIYTEITKLAPLVEGIRAALTFSDQALAETQFLHAGLSAVSYA